MAGALHPLDLKNAVAAALDELLAPIRTWFEKDSRARELYEFVRMQEITR
jgi:tyrosyl-tRNA synthetase